MELSHVELQADDGEHEDGHKQQQANLQQGDHSLHNGFEHHLQAWRTQDTKTISQQFILIVNVDCIHRANGSIIVN